MLFRSVIGLYSVSRRLGGSADMVLSSRTSRWQEIEGPVKIFRVGGAVVERYIEEIGLEIMRVRIFLRCLRRR